MYKIADCTSLPFADNEFDTVVDTLSLQSCFDLRGVLAEMKRVCRDGGKLLLITRGASSIDLYNQYLSFRAGLDLEKEGTVFHLDFENIIRGEPGLEVEYLERKNMGMTCICILRNRKSTLEPKVEDKTAKDNE